VGGLWGGQTRDGWEEDWGRDVSPPSLHFSHPHIRQRQRRALSPNTHACSLVVSAHAPSPPHRPAAQQFCFSRRSRFGKGWVMMMERAPRTPGSRGSAARGATSSSARWTPPSSVRRGARWAAERRRTAPSAGAARFDIGAFSHKLILPLLFCAPHPLLLPSAEDAFNLYGLRTAVSNFKECIEIILDVAPRSGASKS
jgi:hypothetical protein